KKIYFRTDGRQPVWTMLSSFTLECCAAGVPCRFHAKRLKFGAKRHDFVSDSREARTGRAADAGQKAFQKGSNPKRFGAKRHDLVSDSREARTGRAADAGQKAFPKGSIPKRFGAKRHDLVSDSREARTGRAADAGQK